ncbi:MAG: hypothetical protein IAC68_01245 [Bacteroidetes bacterium]|uniref:Uncharacterized protein n=1 Tax=Candidatus Egerieousia excrementavium TaxID=2840778 RepID=A0A9D9DJW7_9BACT|nr:hypothetical protein [Candidatus Egerieousia excrementavium]
MKQKTIATRHLRTKIAAGSLVSHFNGTLMKECTQIKEKGADAEKPESFNIVIEMTRCNFLAKQKLRINKILIIN